MKMKIYIIMGVLVLVIGTGWVTYNLGEYKGNSEKNTSELMKENQELQSTVSEQTKENSSIGNVSSTQIQPSTAAQPGTTLDFKKLEEYSFISTKNYMNLYQLYKNNMGKSNFGKYEKTRVIIEFLLDFLESDPSHTLKWVDGEDAKNKIDSYKKDVYRGPMSINQIRYIDLGEDLLLKDLSDLQTEADILRDTASVTEKAYGEVDRSKMYDTYKEKWIFDLKRVGDSFKIINWTTKN